MVRLFGLRSMNRRPATALPTVSALTGLCVAGLFVACLAVVPIGVRPAFANERILSDPSDQLALLGYDAVSFFTEEQAIIGQPNYEVLYAGLVWRFAHSGNLEAFSQNPASFLPAYGGMCAFRAAEGLAVHADPNVFLVLGPRVFFFSSRAARYAFLLEAEFLIAEADTVWPEVIETLSP